MAKQYSIPFYERLFFATSTFLLFVPTLLAEKDNYIVRMDSSAMPKAFSAHHSWHLATLSSVFEVSKSRSSVSTATTAAAKPSKLLYSYTHVIDGFSAHLSPAEHEILKNSTGYISSIKDLPVKPDTTRSPSYLGLTSNSEAWKLSNYGESIIIGVIDSGVWPESESFSDNGMPRIPKRWKGKCESGVQFNSSLCNNKLIGARFYNKGLIAKWNTTISMNSTRDTEGHGTHTSSTAAGNFVRNVSYFGYAPGTASGVAPRAHIAMYKALWQEGSYTSDIIAAIDQAIIDGVDILSISLGLDDLALYEDPVALATFAAVEKNIFVSASAGNRGPFRGALHNGMPWVTTIAAGTVDREFEAVLKLGNGVSVTGLSLYPGNYTTSRQVPMVFKGKCLDNEDLLNVGGYIVVCEEEYGNLHDLEDQYDNVRDTKNVTGGIFITKSIDLENYIQSRFPAIFMNLKDGIKIKDYINSTTKPQASMEFKKTTVGVKSAPSLTSYSSRGPSLACPSVLKPDIMAPGSLILAAWPENIIVDRIDDQEIFNNFNLQSGTSMACPHVAGIAALLKKAHPDWSPAAIRSAMMTTADTMTQAKEPIRDIDYGRQPATPLDMGSGQINPNKALDPGLIYDANLTSYINFLCALNLTQKQIQTITKSPNNDCSSPSSDLNYPSFLAYFNADSSEANLTAVQEYHRTVTNVGDPVSTYTANLTPINGIKASVVPNKLVFKAKYEKLSYKLSIQGPNPVPEDVVFGYLSWVDSKGKYVVKSPITVTSLKYFDVDD
ncbi:subtilisin-like protease SBT3 [Ricinus communis]|uniref:Cucumisin, putative n=1 Tax=Ricinus communis TaxID=3988 RepID=B9R7A3_RICCO|nr:subtilisin-like protease SBT3 [Ricinus communis]EEF52383.1 Cucumisin precursor, putative [Ricinus communis]|eukprot:XP_002510196.1 subtilisin-like protease SBT1.9 [Ricinus communis]